MRDPTRGPRAFRVGCWRRRVTAVLEEWLSRRRKAARQNPAYRLAPHFLPPRAARKRRAVVFPPLPQEGAKGPGDPVGRAMWAVR